MVMSALLAKMASAVAIRSTKSVSDFPLIFTVRVARRIAGYLVLDLILVLDERALILLSFASLGSFSYLV